MENVQNHDVQVILNQVCYSVMPERKHSDMALSQTVPLSNLRKFP